MNERGLDAVLTNVTGQTPKFCDVCGSGLDTRHWHGGNLYICDLCDLPSNQQITTEENRIWKALMYAKAGERGLRNALGSKVSVWFIERYQRLGLTR